MFQTVDLIWADAEQYKLSCCSIENTRIQSIRRNSKYINFDMGDRDTMLTQFPY